MAAPPTTKKTKQPKKPAKPGTDPKTLAQIQQMLDRFQQGLGLLGPQQYGATFAQMNRLFPSSTLGPNYSPAQLRQQAQSAMAQIFNPRIKSIRDTFARQGKLGAENITGYTGTYANRLGDIPVAISNANQQGMQQQAAVGGALADYMRNTGAEISGDLQNRLAATNLSEGQIAGTVGNAADTGFLGSGEIAGLNSSSLMRMADEGNAWLKWGQALPGIGILQGQQELGKFQGQLNDAFLTQMADLSSSMAEQGVNLYQNMLDRDLERRGLGLTRDTARAGFYGDSQQRKLNAALGSTSLLQSWSQMLINKMLEEQRIAADIYGTDASIYGTDVAASTPPKTAPPKPGEPGGPPLPKSAAERDITSQALNIFPAYNPMPGSPQNVSIHVMRPRVMSWLRSVAQGIGYTEKELAVIRDRILRTLGYSEQKKPPTTTTSQTRPEEEDGGNESSGGGGSTSHPLSDIFKGVIPGLDFSEWPPW